MSIVESDGPPSWSLDVSETGESTKCLWVGMMGLKAWGDLHHPYPRAFCTLPSFARIKRLRWRPVGLKDRHLRSNGKIGDCEQSKRLGTCAIYAVLVTFPFHHTKFPRSTSNIQTISSSVLSPIILPLQTFFSRVLLLRPQAFYIRKSFPREGDDNNYSDKNTSPYVSLRTRKFDEKIQYCCRGSFFVEEDI